MTLNKNSFNNTAMKITKRSPFTGKVNTLDIPVTQEQLDNWRNGELIQNAMPNLTASQREFIMTGILDDSEWDEMLGPEG